MDTELPQRLIKARSGHGWSQADLAEVSGIAAAQISRYEQGRSKPRTEVIAKIAKALAVSFEWLAYGKGEIDGGADVLVYPASQVHSFQLDLENDPELREALEWLADHKGLTLEMTLKQSLLDVARDARAARAADIKAATKKKP